MTKHRIEREQPSLEQISVDNIEPDVATDAAKGTEAPSGDDKGGCNEPVPAELLAGAPQLDIEARQIKAILDGRYFRIRVTGEKTCWTSDFSWDTTACPVDPDQKATIDFQTADGRVKSAWQRIGEFMIPGARGLTKMVKE